uniref:Dynein light chain n=1 Tax=Panagrolaimus sp. JU765 TaxID=591449 RepID=A0AC34R9X9_9BILA
MENTTLKRVNNVTEVMWRAALQLSVEAIDCPLFNVGEMSQFIRKKFEKMFEGRWACLVARSSSFSVDHFEAEIVIQYKKGDINYIIGLFKCW